MKRHDPIILLILGLNFFSFFGIAQQTTLHNGKDLTSLKNQNIVKPICQSGFIDKYENAVTKSGKFDYYLELLPGTSFTGSWYFWVTGSGSMAADLIESPEVDWLLLTPTQFTDYADGIATKVDYIFSIPNNPTFLSTTIIDQNGNWEQMNISVLVTNHPNLNLNIYDEQIEANELFENIFQDQCPTYFYWALDDQYYYPTQMMFNYLEYPDQTWFSVQPSNFLLYPDESNYVTFSANIPTTGFDTVLIFKQKQHYTYPVFHQYNFEVTESSTLDVQPANRDVSSSAGTTTFSVTSNTTWTVAESVSWLSVTPMIGNENGTLTVVYNENTTAASRTGQITVMTSDGSVSTNVTVNQAGACSLSVTPVSQNVAYTTGSTSFTITSNTSWTVTDNASWLSVSPASGTGNGTIIATFSENTSSASRTALITINGCGNSFTVTVIQAGNCTFSFSPASLNLPPEAGSTNILITSNGTWSASESLSWLSLSPSSGTGNATIAATYSANAGSSRTGVITFDACGTQYTMTVSQSATCSFSITPSARNVPYTQGNTTFSITSNTSWTVTDDVTWMTVGPSSGTGNGTITAYYSTNNFTSTRTATISIQACGTTYTVTVIQAEPPCSFSISPVSHEVAYTSGGVYFYIYSNSTWSLTDDADWLTVTPTNGIVNGILTASFTANTGNSTRIATITIYTCVNSYTATVTQTPNCSFSVSPANQNVGYQAGQVTFTITSNNSWTVSDDVGWLTLSPTSGTNNGSVTADFEENTTPSARVATLSFNACSSLYNVTVTQDVPSNIFDIIPLNAGWNLISFDVYLNPDTPADVFQQIISSNNLQMVTGFQNQIGVFFDPDGLPFLNTLQHLNEGEGYWVKVNNAANLVVYGPPILNDFTLDLSTGWNLIGYWPHTNTTPEIAYAELIAAGVLIMVTGYDDGGKFFDPNGPPFLNTLNSIENGRGYWVKLSANFQGFTYP